jgi:hypothetical protein
MVKKRPHQWGKLKAIPWPVCTCCGLVWLKNERTAAAVRAGCEQ